MEWHEVETQDDADAFLGWFEDFHDWYIAGFDYDPLARAADDDKDLGRFVCDTDRLTLHLRWDSKNRYGEWPEVVIEFLGVDKMGFSSIWYPNPISAATLLDTERGWVFLDDELHGDELVRPWEVSARTFVHAACVRWREAGGTWWRDVDADLDE